MRVVRHDDKAMELKAVLIAIAKENCDEEFGIRRALEVAMLLECRDGYGIGVRLLADRGHIEESIPQGLKPPILGGS
jgi:hypothetical protein